MRAALDPWAETTCACGAGPWREAGAGQRLRRVRGRGRNAGREGLLAGVRRRGRGRWRIDGKGDVCDMLQVHARTEGPDTPVQLG